LKLSDTNCVQSSSTVNLDILNTGIFKKALDQGFTCIFFLDAFTKL
jgi:hypothetical protein